MPKVTHATDVLVSRFESDSVPVWPVSLADVKSRAQIYHSSDDTELVNGYSGIIPEVVDAVEERGRVALIKQLRKVTWTSWPTAIYLPRGPVLSIESGGYIDADGDAQTIDLTGVRFESDGSTLLLAVDAQAVTAGPAAFWLTYYAGYGDAATDVPPRWRYIVRDACAHYWANRDPANGSSTNDDRFQMWLERSLNAAGRPLRYA